jgi:hypothetical protein
MSIPIPSGSRAPYCSTSKWVTASLPFPKVASTGSMWKTSRPTPSTVKRCPVSGSHSTPSASPFPNVPTFSEASTLPKGGRSKNTLFALSSETYRVSSTGFTLSPVGSFE